MDLSRTIFSECRKHRFLLYRQWGDNGVSSAGNRDIHVVHFVGLNPSAADKVENDSTVKRMVGFAKRWEFDALRVTNLLSLVETHQAKIPADGDLFCEENMNFVWHAHMRSCKTVFAWGAMGKVRDPGKFRRLAWRVAEMIPDACCLNYTKDGHPRHPLFVKGDTEPVLFERKEVYRRREGD